MVALRLRSNSRLQRPLKEAKGGWVSWARTLHKPPEIAQRTIFPLCTDARDQCRGEKLHLQRDPRRKESLTETKRHPKLESLGPRPMHKFPQIAQHSIFFTSVRSQRNALSTSPYDLFIWNFSFRSLHLFFRTARLLFTQNAKNSRIPSKSFRSESSVVQNPLKFCCHLIHLCCASISTKISDKFSNLV